MRTLFLVAALVASSCASVGPAPEARRFSASRDFSSAYVTVPEHQAKWETRIDFSGGQLIYSGPDSGQATRAMSDAGRSIHVAETPHAIYIEELPFSVPKGEKRAWSTDAFRCVANEAEQGTLISCASHAATFRSFYTHRRGIEWFEYACGPYTGEICRYRLVSSTGIFSSR